MHDFLFMSLVYKVNKQKDKKIVFSEEIDSSINGIALGTAFVMLSIFVVYFKIFNTTI